MKRFAWFVLFMWIYAGCLSSDRDDREPVRQVHQAGAWNPFCIGCITVTGTRATDAAPSWFATEGLTLVVPGVRCIDTVLNPGFVPQNVSCSDIWRGFPVSNPPTSYRNTVGTYAARWVVLPSAAPMNATPITLWMYQDIYDEHGNRLDFRWKYVIFQRRAEGLLFRLVDYNTGEDAPRVHGSGCTRRLFTYFPSSSLYEYTRLINAGYMLDITQIAAFRPYRDGALEARVGRVDLIPSELLPTREYTVSPQNVLRRYDQCWFNTNYFDGAPAAGFPLAVNNREEYLRSYFGITAM